MAAPCSRGDPIARKTTMKKMNKAIAATLTAAMLLSMGTTTAFAETTTSATGNSDNSYKTDLTTNVKYAVTESYEWTIHSDIDFGSNGTIGKTIEKTGNKVSVTKNVIPADEKLVISVKGSGENSAFTIATTGGAKLNYTIKKSAENISTGAAVLEVNSGTNTAEADLTYTLTTEATGAEKAGSYTGTVTYSAEVVKVNPSND